MIQKNKWKLLLSSVVILLPIVAGLLLWDVLPEEIATHWGADGAVDGWSSKARAVFLPPTLFLLLDWLCLWVTAADPGNKRQSRKAFDLVLWICPVLSLFCSGTVYAAAMGMEYTMERLVPLVMGLAFAVIGNYMPKVRQNHTIGIKLIWTIRSEENWNRTHRFAGKAWVIGGLVMALGVFLPEGLMVLVMVASIILLAVAPMVYSWIYYRKQVREGRTVPVTKDRFSSGLSRASLLITAAILVFVGVMLFTGDIALEYGDSFFTVKADYHQDLTVDYAAVDSIEYREERVPGSRTNGYSSFRLLMGVFRNEEFGSYTRYTYTGCDAAVVLRVDDRVLVLGGIDAESTYEIYEQLSDRIS